MGFGHAEFLLSIVTVTFAEMIRGEPAIWVQNIAPTVLYSGVWRRPDHDAAMRIDRGVPGAAGPFSETAWKPCLTRVTATSDRHQRPSPGDRRRVAWESLDVWPTMARATPCIIVDAANPDDAIVELQRSASLTPGGSR